jgi:cytochrome c oxidase subunit II
MKRFLPRLLLLLPFVAMAPAMADSPRTIEVTASHYEFSPERIEMKMGERVRLNVRSVDGAHGFFGRALGIDMKIPADGTPVAIDLAPTQPGTYVIQCSEYCGRGHRVMKARLVVTPAEETSR